METSPTSLATSHQPGSNAAATVRTLAAPIQIKRNATPLEGDNEGMFETGKTFTAAQIAAALGCAPQAVRVQLRGVDAADVRKVSGNEADAWTVNQLPARMRERLAIESVKKNCKGDNLVGRMETLLSLPRRQWQPPIALSNISQASFDAAEKLREALKPFLTAPQDASLTAEEWKQRGADYYFRVFQQRITTHHWDRLFRRTQIRDNGVGNFETLAIYLPNRLKRKPAPAAVAAADLSQDFTGLDNYLRAIKTPGQPDKDECVGIWALALKTFEAMMAAGELEKRAARRVREFLFANAAFLAPSRDALWISFKRKIAALKRADGNLQALADGRAANGDRVEIPKADLDRLRWSVSHNHGGRVDAAWREEYPLLSEYTRQRYPESFKAPAKIHEILNREIVDALSDRHKGKRKLRRRGGTIQRDWTGIPSMAAWVADDLTANMEVILTKPDGTIVCNADKSPYLFTPQVIAVMDSVSRKWVGWTISTAKAPNAGIVCDAVVEAIKTHGVPKELGLEGGFVFGKSLLVNGKEDEQGRAMVLGLGQFGCAVRHFEKMNPTSKSELEKSFDQIQQRMERHPGYTGRLQMIDAPEEFKRDQWLIHSGKIEATKVRYTFDEFIVIFNQMVLNYNAAVQRGRLKGLSPNEAFAFQMDANDPPIKFTPKLEWLVNNEREIVKVGSDGVRFKHRTTGQEIKVRGGKLAHLVGEELWALTDRGDASMVTFMTLDHTNPFTMEACKKPSARESAFAPGSGVLAKERAKIREFERVMNEEYHRLQGLYGNPRRDLLAQVRQQQAQDRLQAGASTIPVRHIVLPCKMAESGEQMKQQRAEITAAKDQKTRRTAANKTKARRDGIPSVMVEDSEQDARALELLRAGTRGLEPIEISEGENQ